MASCMIPLTQMTPLIHFQYEQEGATLRASEFKPKLDRFLCDFAFSPDEAKPLFVGYSSAKPNQKCKPAFDYRLTIRAKDTRMVDIPKSTPYFTIDSVPYKGSLSSSVELYFRSYYTELIAQIKKWLPRFLAVHNFGFRQDKGFGSFWVTNSNSIERFGGVLKNVLYDEPSEVGQARKPHEKSKFLPFPEDRMFALKIARTEGTLNRNEGNRTWIDALNVVQSFHKRLKSGLNIYGPGRVQLHYARAFSMKDYLSGKGYGNDKKAVKQFLLREVTPAAGDTPSNYRYIRGLLGLADHFDWGGRNISIQHDVGEEEPAIARFATPILYKVLLFDGDAYIVILPQKLPDAITDKPFEFRYHGSISFKTPSPGEFDIVTLLNGFMTAPSAPSLGDSFELSDDNFTKMIPHELRGLDITVKRIRLIKSER